MRRTEVVGLALALVALQACSSNGSRNKKDTSKVGDTGIKAEVTGRDGLLPDASAADRSAADTARSDTTAPDTAHVTMWPDDFSVNVVDPAQDDTGDGNYTYPSGVGAGAVDLRSFSLAYKAKTGTIEIKVGLTAITDSTRVGLVLMDETAFKGGQREWTIGGAEIRIPQWNYDGVSFALSRPQFKSALFDYNVTHANPPGSPRPDNAIYVHETPTQWLDASGLPTQTTASVRRLNVTEDTVATPQTLSFSIAANDLASYVNVGTPKLYAVLFAYLVVDTTAKKYCGFMEYGGYDLCQAEGGIDGWEDCDAYDIAFVDKPADQPQLLTVTGSGMGAVVVLDTVGKGVLEIPTQKTTP